MRVMLLLTVGLPVFAAQVVAFALPRVELAPFALLRRAVETVERATTETKVLRPARTLPPAFAFQPVAGVGFVAAATPEDSSARALLFVQHVRRQAT